MNRDEELNIIKRCIEHFENKTSTLADSESSSEVSRYLSKDRFDSEESRIFKSLPSALAHVSELAELNSFKRVKSNLGELLLTRDGGGKVNAFYNACRHRGTMLVQEDSGCSQRLTCPYHAWSYNTKGELESVPAQSSCFPNISKSTLGLKALACVEKYGFIWVWPKPANNIDAETVLDQHLGAVAGYLNGLKMQNLEVFQSRSKVWNANWKILAEGALETYHFSFAHRNTIGPKFLNNVSLIDFMSDHVRVVMPTKAIKYIVKKQESDRYLRDFTHTLYSVFPQSLFLVQEKHIDWIRTRPISTGLTEIVISSLIPDDSDSLSAEKVRFWTSNFNITIATLDEDFILGESIQSSMSAGAISSIQYGRNEGALKQYNNIVDENLACR